MVQIGIVVNKTKCIDIAGTILNVVDMIISKMN